MKKHHADLARLRLRRLAQRINSFLYTMEVRPWRLAVATLGVTVVLELAMILVTPRTRSASIAFGLLACLGTTAVAWFAPYVNRHHLVLLRYRCLWGSVLLAVAAGFDALSRLLWPDDQYSAALGPAVGLCPVAAAWGFYIMAPRVSGIATPWPILGGTLMWPRPSLDWPRPTIMEIGYSFSPPQRATSRVDTRHLFPALRRRPARRRIVHPDRPRTRGD
jgi:hypothetical protein